MIIRCSAATWRKRWSSMIERITIAAITLAIIIGAAWLCYDIITTPDDPSHRYE